MIVSSTLYRSCWLLQSILWTRQWTYSYWWGGLLWTRIIAVAMCLVSEQFEQVHSCSRCGSSLSRYILCHHHGYHAWNIAVWSSERCTEGAVRLTGAISGMYGAVEFCANGTWGAVCGTDWENRDASVACRQLGHSPYGS